MAPDSVDETSDGKFPRLMMGITAIPMSIIIALIAGFYVGQLNGLANPPTEMEGPLSTLSILLIVVIITAIATLISSILTFKGFSFSKMALIGSSSAMLILLIIAAWVHSDVIDLTFETGLLGDEYSDHWSMNPWISPSALAAYCNLVGLVIIGIFAFISKGGDSEESGLDDKDEEAAQHYEEMLSGLSSTPEPVDPNTVESWHHLPDGDYLDPDEDGTIWFKASNGDHWYQNHDESWTKWV